MHEALNSVTIGNLFSIITASASFITAIVVLASFSRKGRDWINRPSMDLIRKLTADIESRMTKVHEKMDAAIESNTTSILRNEILLLVYTNPKDARTIERAYDKYKERGGNSYIDGVVQDWRAEYHGT